LYYNVQSGRPFSLIFGTDMNGDGFATNDLLYLPNDVIIVKNAGSTWTGDPNEQWNKFLASAGVTDPASGRIMERYELEEPWVRQMDFSYELGLPAFGGVRTSVTADVMNLLNMFDKNAGNVRFVPNQNFLPVTYGGIDSATGKPIYRERFADTIREDAHLSTADLRSRWQARLGVRVTF
ncbi:MAG TPA: hypothetical protein VF701_13690, partial [Thermoanaerobaculia bacterium]